MAGAGPAAGFVAGAPTAGRVVEEPGTGVTGVVGLMAGPTAGPTAGFVAGAPTAGRVIAGGAGAGTATRVGGAGGSRSVPAAAPPAAAPPAPTCVFCLS